MTPPLDAGELAHLEHLRERRGLVAAAALANDLKIAELNLANRGLRKEMDRVDKEIDRLVKGVR